MLAMNKQLPTKTAITSLSGWDVAVLTGIFFGTAIYQSTLQFWTLQATGQSAPTDVGFDTTSNYWGIGFELFCLALATSYLLWRKFDFRQLDFRVNYYTLPLALLFAVSADMVAASYDFFNSLVHVSATSATEAGLNGLNNGLDNGHGLTIDTVVYSLLNGFYEELYFLGLLFCVPKRYYGWMYGFSLLVRLSFHTYQGLESAIVITSLGVVFLLYRRRLSMLVPFMLAHAFFDMYGLGATSYWLLSMAFFGS